VSKLGTTGLGPCAPGGSVLVAGPGLPGGSGPKEGRGSQARRRHAAQHKRSKPDQGFTLVELLIAIVILMTIAAIAIPSFLAARESARVARAVGDIAAIETGIALYDVTNNGLPDTLAQAGFGSLLDPWGAPYQYLNHEDMKGNGQARKDRFLVPLNDDYDLYSMGPDGVSTGPITAKASQDDIIRAGTGSFIGVAADF
jgi:general secretion pathway protein G